MNIQTTGAVLCALLFLACNTAQKAQSPPLGQTPNPELPKSMSANAPSRQGVTTPPLPHPFVTWDKKMVDLGKIKKGEKRTLFFELTNTSGQEIQVDIVDACECTKVDFPRGPIAPGGKGRFDATFDSTEKDAPETIGINVVFRNTDAAGNPRIETVEYKFEIEK